MTWYRCYRQTLCFSTLPSLVVDGRVGGTQEATSPRVRRMAQLDKESNTSSHTSPAVSGRRMPSDSCTLSLPLVYREQLARKPFSTYTPLVPISGFSTLWSQLQTCIWLEHRRFEGVSSCCSVSVIVGKRAYYLAPNTKIKAARSRLVRVICSFDRKKTGRTASVRSNAILTT